MAEIISSGSTAATSSDITVVANTPQTVFLTTVSGPAVSNGLKVNIQIKGADDQYMTVDTLNYKKQAVILYGPGLYRVQREAGRGTCAVNLNAT